MIGAFCAVLVAAVAAVIAMPLSPIASVQARDEPAANDELWQHEKAVALLAIAEADFDRATGKLSNDDYAILRSDYEGRALRAIGELDRLDTLPVVGLAVVPAGFCGHCGVRFKDPDRYCSSCGSARG